MLNGNSHPRRYPLRAVGYAAGILAFSAVMASGFVKCPLAMAFHVPCPACGSTRAARALLTLDFATAFRFNPLAPIVICALALLVWRALVLVFHEGNARRVDEERLGRAFLYVAVWATIGETLVWVVRFFGLLGGPCPV